MEDKYKKAKIFAIMFFSESRFIIIAVVSRL